MLNIINSAKPLLKLNTIMLHIAMISELFFTQFRIRLTPDAKVQTQVPPKVPIQYRNKLNTLLDDSQKNGIPKETGSTHLEKPNYGTTYLNPLIIKKIIQLKMCWMLDISTQTLIN